MQQILNIGGKFVEMTPEIQAMREIVAHAMEQAKAHGVDTTIITQKEGHFLHGTQTQNEDDRATSIITSIVFLVSLLDEEGTYTDDILEIVRRMREETLNEK